MPILPKHIWGEYTIEQIQNAEAEGFFSNQPPIVGTGPYQAVEWEAGDFIRFARNESYWGNRVPRTRSSSRTSTTRAPWSKPSNGEVDYIRGVEPTSSTRSPARRTSRPSKGSRTGTPISRSTPRATARATTVRPRRSPTLRSGTRSATRSIAIAWSRRHSPGMASRAIRTFRRTTRTGTSRRTRRAPSTSRKPHGGLMPRATHSMPTTGASTRKAIRSPSA